MAFNKSQKLNTTYLLLGSNMGNPHQKLVQATRFISKEIGPIIRSSSIYSTKAWGNTQQPDFLNQVIIVSTKLDPQKTISAIFKIEQKMGRIRTIKNAPRLIDIDILFFNKEIITSVELTIPHPLMQERRFVMTPLNELSPNLKHPVLNKSVHKILKSCKDKLTVNKI